MKNKKIILMFVALVLVSLIAVMSVSAEETTLDGLVTFDGYSARMLEYNGLRSQYTLNTEKLAQLEEIYSVEIGILIGTMETDDEASYNALTVENNIYKSVFYSTKEGYVGKYYGNAETDKTVEFVYSITFAGENTQTKENYERNLTYRVYISLTDANEQTSITYVDNISEMFGYTLSLEDVATRLTADAATNFPMLQRVVSLCNGTPILEMEFLSRDLDRYSIVIGQPADEAVATELNTALKNATGYTLPVVMCGETVSSSALFSDAYIYINTSVDLSSSNAYTVVIEEGFAEIKAETVSTAKKAAKAFVEALKDANYEVIDAIKYVPDWTKPIK